MSKYIPESKRLADWIKKALFDIGDGEARNLNQFIAKAKLEGFKDKNVISFLDTFSDLGGVEYNKIDNFIISTLNIKNVVLAKIEEKEATKEMKIIKEAQPLDFKGNIIKEDSIIIKTSLGEVIIEEKKEESEVKNGGN